MEGFQEWAYFDYHDKLKSKLTKTCITCAHFRYSTTDQCVTILTCLFHQKLIPQGDHLIKGCIHWRKDRKLFAPEAS